MIELKQVTKEYDRVIFKDVNICLRDNSINLLKGPSGSGKTTLLNIITNLDLNYTGNVLLDGKNIRLLNEDELKISFSYVYQQSMLISQMNIMENLLFIFNNLEQVKKIASICGIEDLLERMPNEISNGQRQRVAVARALLDNSEVIIADEPTSSLDIESAKEIASLLLSLKDYGKTVIISSHDSIFNKGFDQIITIDRQSVSIVSFEQTEVCSKEKAINHEEGKYFIKDYQYVTKRIKKANLLSLIIKSIIFLIFFISITLTISHREILNSIIFKTSNLNLALVNEQLLHSEEYSNILKKYSFEIYPAKSYIDNGIIYIGIPNQINILNDQEVYKYFDKSNVIKGRKDLNNKTAIVDTNYLEKILKVSDDSSIGKYIDVLDKEMIVGGVVSNNKLPLYMLSGGLYQVNKYTNETPVVLLDYDYLSQNSIENEGLVFIYLENMYELSNSELKSFEGIYNVNPIIQARGTFAIFSGIVIAVAVVLSIIIAVYTMNILMLELQLRKKEFGYLQLFKVGKKRVKRIFVIEYFLTNVYSICLAFAITNLVIMLLSNILDVSYLKLALNLLIVLIIIFTYICILAILPINRLLKNKTLNLIK